ncbi:HEAT repeat domain-containing protein [Deinococcus roseus]|uniref:HEAT repeat domain-containing protein n=1 Tax=Deinococcus roseus TaxID=392414 RepID=A0ABQ2D6U5_9DEIO|nr:HEAT repeat domain-containing protein [Deinococcus roseus]GGJ46765.1 hypothetical protein GCM10008938_36160 [Deinococcus roseus]
MEQIPLTFPELSARIEALQHALWQETEDALLLLIGLEDLMVASRTAVKLAVPVLAGTLQHPDVRVQAMSARILAAFGGFARQARPELQRLLDHQDPYLRGCAVLALSQQNQDLAAVHFQRLLEEEDVWGLFVATHALVFLQSEAGPFLEAFRSVLQDPSQVKVGHWQVGQGIELPEKNPIRLLLARLPDLHPSFRELDPQVIPLLQNPDVVDLAARLLKNRPGNQDAVQVLSDHLWNAQAVVLIPVLSALAGLQLPLNGAATARLYELCQHDWPDVRLQAARVLWFCQQEGETSRQVAWSLLDPETHSQDSLLYGHLVPDALLLLQDQGFWQGDLLTWLTSMYQNLFRTPSVGPGDRLVSALWQITHSPELVFADVLRVLRQGNHPDRVLGVLREMGVLALPILLPLQEVLQTEGRLLQFSGPVYHMEQLWEEEQVRADLEHLLEHLQLAKDGNTSGL